MKMELIQPFINAADAVLAEGLQCSTTVGSLSMEEEAYRRKGVAALIWVSGDIEGRSCGEQVRRDGAAGIRHAGPGNRMRAGKSSHRKCHYRA